MATKNKVLTEQDPIPNPPAEFPCSKCSYVGKTNFGLQMHQRMKHKQVISLDGAFTQHTERHTALPFNMCASVPCTRFPRSERAQLLERKSVEFKDTVDSAFETMKALSEAGWSRDPREELSELVRGQSSPPATTASLTVQGFESRPKVQIAVYYLDDTTRWYPVPSGEGWKVDTVNRQIIVGRGVPRTHIPLDTVRAFNVEPYGSNGYNEE